MQNDKKLSSVKGRKVSPLTSIPEPGLDNIVHYLMMQAIKARETGVPLPSFPNGRHRYFPGTCYKSFRAVNRIKGAALVLQKRQFIKKPKNPI